LVVVIFGFASISLVIGWEDRLRSYLYCVKWEAKSYCTYMYRSSTDALTLRVVPSL